MNESSFQVQLLAAPRGLRESGATYLFRRSGSGVRMVFIADVTVLIMLRADRVLRVQQPVTFCPVAAEVHSMECFATCARSLPS